MARVTSADVARASGVSRTTVSYVLNGRRSASGAPAISEATRTRVLEAAEQLGYAPSAAARSLRSGSSDLVLAVLPGWPIGPSMDTILGSVAAALAEHGLAFVVHHALEEQALSQVWRSLDPVAVIGFAPFPDDDVRRMRAAGAVVLAPGAEGEANGPHGLVDARRRSAELQVEHLAARGHRDLVFVRPDDRRLRAFADARLAGARAACERLGLPAPHVTTLGADRAACAAAVRGWLAADPPVTGVCAYNDDLALAVLAGAHDAGVAVPDRLAVVGVDDTPAGRLGVPPLTTVSLHPEVQAQFLAAGVLAGVGLVEAAPLPQVVPELVVRASS